MLRRAPPAPTPTSSAGLMSFASPELEPIDIQLLALLLLLVLLIMVTAKLTGIQALLLPDAARRGGLAQLPQMMVRKTKLVLFGGAFLLFSKDKVSSKQLGKAHGDGQEMERVEREIRIIFIRHGESVWNYVFNRGFAPSFLVRWLLTTLHEMYLLPWDDSVYIDSPLSELGMEQCKELRAFLRKPCHDPLTQEDFKALTAGESHSLIISSQLRRAASTTAIALSDRLQRSREAIVLLSHLQEISRNFDTLALAPASATPPMEPSLNFLSPAAYFDGSANFGNKTFGFTGLKRLQAFAEWVADRPERTIIVGGHSLWFRNFFALYLPKSSTHQAKKKKIINCGVVGFTLQVGRDRQTGLPMYRIDEESIASVYGGFATK